ncbi:MAG: class I SAM-dependent methyltransferase [Candidatus Aminicenantes bacterium]|nr:class I SAM-dependent methyltransferase [Candidatus Aminicenantes bacterium]
MVKRSLKKREKLKLLEKHLDIRPHDIVLDLGCAQGILSYFLRKKGGLWVSADLDLINCKTSLALLKNNIVQIGADSLPFKDASFDKVVSLDYLEHLDNDSGCLEEINRILKKDGELLLATPRTGKVYLLNKLRPFLGMKMEFYGHKREGYSLKDLDKKLDATGFVSVQHKSFSRFFSEFLELLLNFLYIKLYESKDPIGLRDGHIRPSTSDEFSSRKKAFRMYSFIYPLVWLFTRLDNLFFFQRGYGLMVWAKKNKLK